MYLVRRDGCSSWWYFYVLGEGGYFSVIVIFTSFFRVCAFSPPFFFIQGS